MERIHRSVLIKAPVDQLFAYLADPRNHPEWVPGVTETSDIVGTGEGQRHRWKYKMAGVPLKGETVAAQHVPNERLVLRSSGGSESTWTFEFAGNDDEVTLTLTIDYTIPIPVLGRFAAKLISNRNEREIDLAMENIRERLEH